jgi:hypothetical protein
MSQMPEPEWALAVCEAPSLRTLLDLYNAWVS